MMFMNLINHLFNVVTGSKFSLFHFESVYQSERFRVVIPDRPIYWDRIHTDKETFFVVLIQ